MSRDIHTLGISAAGDCDICGKDGFSRTQIVHHVEWRPSNPYEVCDTFTWCVDCYRTSAATPVFYPVFEPTGKLYRQVDNRSIALDLAIHLNGKVDTIDLRTKPPVEKSVPQPTKSNDLRDVVQKVIEDWFGLPVRQQEDQDHTRYAVQSPTGRTLVVLRISFHNNRAITLPAIDGFWYPGCDLRTLVDQQRGRHQPHLNQH